MASVKSILEARGIAPNKRLGQNFLVHPEVAEKIAAWSHVPPSAPVIEIGPGLGALTEVLLRQNPVFAIEKDRKLFAYLASHFEGNPKLSMVHADALIFDYGGLPKMESPYFVCSNLPYSVSTPMIEVLLRHRELFSAITLLLQKELIDRLLANPGTSNYGSLTIFVQSHCDVEAGPLISKGSFHPVPDVDSKMIRLTPRKTLRPSVSNSERFFDFVKSMFQFRRKSIRKALEHVVGLPGKEFTLVLPDALLSDRIENRSIEEIADLFEKILPLWGKKPKGFSAL